MVGCSPFKLRSVAVLHAEEEDEYLANGKQKLRYLHSMLQEFSWLHEPTVIYEDIQPCILWAPNMINEISTWMCTTIVVASSYEWGIKVEVVSYP